MRRRIPSYVRSASVNAQVVYICMSGISECVRIPVERTSPLYLSLAISHVRIPYHSMVRLDFITTPQLPYQDKKRGLSFIKPAPYAR